MPPSSPHCVHNITWVSQGTRALAPEGSNPGRCTGSGRLEACKDGMQERATSPLRQPLMPTWNPSLTWDPSPTWDLLLRRDVTYRTSFAFLVPRLSMWNSYY